MNCWSCRREIPPEAKHCPHCEAEVTDEPQAEELAAAAGVLAEMPPEVFRELHDAFANSTTGEEFVNRIMVGDCPRCESSDTTDCEQDPDLQDPCLGRCCACGQVWCLDCGKIFQDSRAPVHACPAWEDGGDSGGDEIF